jgi:hypothetical protein
MEALARESRAQMGSAFPPGGHRFRCIVASLATSGARLLTVVHTAIWTGRTIPAQGTAIGSAPEVLA